MKVKGASKDSTWLKRSMYSGATGRRAQADGLSKAIQAGKRRPYPLCELGTDVALPNGRRNVRASEQERRSCYTSIALADHDGWEADDDDASMNRRIAHTSGHHVANEDGRRAHRDGVGRTDAGGHISDARGRKVA